MCMRMCVCGGGGGGIRICLHVGELVLTSLHEQFLFLICGNVFMLICSFLLGRSPMDVVGGGSLLTVL